jgi:hypothetical protein
VTGGISDTLAEVDWEIWTGANGTGTRVFNSASQTTNDPNTGEALFTTPGTYQWTCPSGVTSVCVVAVGGGGGGGGGSTTTDGNGNSPGGGGGGGGGLGWKNNIPVTPGQTYTVVVGAGGIAGIRGSKGGDGGVSYFNTNGLVAGWGGDGGVYAAYAATGAASGGSYAGDGGGNGGAGGYQFNNVTAGGGGGAGGYSGTGGRAATNATGSSTAGQGGGGGAGYGSGNSSGSGGGGVGPFGQGSNGAASVSASTGGGGGSGGNNGTPAGGGSYYTAGQGASYGGGGGGASGAGNAGTAAAGGNGFVRIVWGSGRAFPSTNVTQSATGTVASTSATVNSNVLSNNTTYYPRVRHIGAKLGASAWSALSSFTVNYPLLPTVVGESWTGGYYAGDVTYGGKTYAIIVAPKATGEADKQQLQGNGQYSGNDNDSLLNTNNLAALNGAAAVWAKTLSIGGKSDWLVPSLAVMQVISNNLRPGGASTPAIFKTGGTEAFGTMNYWTSSPYNHVVDESYWDADTPIYETQTSTSEVGHSDFSGPIGEYYPINWSNRIKCGAGEGGPNNVDGPTFTQSGTSQIDGEPIGYWNVSWTCTVTSTEQVLVGWEPGDYHQVLTNYYDGWLWNFNSHSSGYTSKQNINRVRAVRLELRS